MDKFIDGIFDVAASLFNRVPFLNKLEGYRTILGFLGLAVMAFLKAKGIGDSHINDYISLGFTGWTGLALNSKGR